MSAPSTITPLPDSFIESEDETVALFVGPAVKAWRKIVELHGTYERVRQANDNAESALESSEAPPAVAYREAQSLADEQLEAIDSEIQERIKAVRAEYAEKRKTISSQVKQLRNETLQSLSLAAVEDIDQDALAASYLANYKALSNVAKLVKDDYPDLIEYVKNSVPSRFSQTPGTGSGKGAIRGWTPRLQFVSVNDKAVSPSTLSAAAKEIGIKASEGGRKFLASKLLESIVTPDNLSTDMDNPSKFSVKYNDKVFNLAVVGNVKSESDSDE